MPTFNFKICDYSERGLKFKKYLSVQLSQTCLNNYLQVKVQKAWRKNNKLLNSFIFAYYLVQLFYNYYIYLKSLFSFAMGCISSKYDIPKQPRYYDQHTPAKNRQQQLKIKSTSSKAYAHTNTFEDIYHENQPIKGDIYNHFRHFGSRNQIMTETSLRQNNISTNDLRRVGTNPYALNNQNELERRNTNPLWYLDEEP